MNLKIQDFPKAGVARQKRLTLRGYRLGPWEPQPRSLYLGVRENGASMEFEFRLKGEGVRAAELGRVEALGPFPLSLKVKEVSGAEIRMSGTLQPGNYRGRYVGEIRVWPLKADREKNYLRIPYLGMIEN
ncbi:MAG: hypothetical protein HC904_17600 [Blastochloris sp.]|nr:hypothetical protein [Blastochloris sp.]